MSISNITLSAGVRQNLLNLQQTADLMSITQGRISTQKKVNSALDNPTNFFTATALNSRANELSNLLDSMNGGINTLKAADNGLTSITATIQSMQATVTQARQDSTWQSTSFTVTPSDLLSVHTINFSLGATTSSPTIDLNTITSAGTAAVLTQTAAYVAPSTAYRAVASGAVYTGLDAALETYTFKVNGGDITLTDSAVGVQSGDTLAHAVASIQSQLDAHFGSGNYTVVANAALGIDIKGKTDGSNDVIVNTVAAGGTAVDTELGFGVTAGAGVSDYGIPADTYDFTVNGVAVQVSTGAGLAQAVIDINTTLIAAGSAFRADSVTVANKLSIKEVVAGGATLTIGGADAGTFTGLTNNGIAAGVAAALSVDAIVADINIQYAGFVKATNDNNKLQITNLSTASLTVNGASGATVDGGGGTATILGNTTRNNLITQFNLLRDQLDKTAGDGSFNGVNLLQGDTLKLFFNEQSTSSLTIVSTNLTGINNTMLNIGNGTATQFQDNSLLDTLLGTLHTALTTVAAQSSAFGSNLVIVNNRQDFTKNMIATLQNGASGLTLADTNEEGANMLALQTRQQLSITALSLASQANQAVLRLFG